MNVADAVSVINQNLPEPQASLLAGMLFGVRRQMPSEFYEALVATGTLHVIALSGMNISIIIRLLFDFSAAVFGKLFGTLFTIFGIIGFVLFVGASPTIVRASLMGSLSILAVYFGRRDIPLLSLFLTAVAMLLIKPSIISNLSFQLSFLSTLGIILFAREKYVEGKKVKHGNSLLSSIKKALKIDFKVTLSAQLFTLPVIFYNFHRVSLISPFANITTGWLVAPITYLGFLAVLLSLIWNKLGYLAFLIVWAPLTVFVIFVRLFSQVPFASFQF